MEQEKYGFVYIWRDKFKDRYYIGCHWGNIDDGYICSSNWMYNSWKRRPQDFRRRILFKCNDKKLMFEKEHQWLQLIPNNELGKIYYNIHKNIPYRAYITGKAGFQKNNIPWHKNGIGSRKGMKTSEETKLKQRNSALGKKKSQEWVQKIIDSKRKNGTLIPSQETIDKRVKSRSWYKPSEETKEKISESHKGKHLSELSEFKIGHIVSEEIKEKISSSNLGKKKPPFSEEHKQNMRKPKSEETKNKMKESAKKRNPEQYKKTIETKKLKKEMLLGVIK